MNIIQSAILAACLASATAGEMITPDSIQITTHSMSSYILGSTNAPKVFYGFTVSNSITTNWVTIGTFTPLTGQPEDVQRGTLATNTTAIIEWRGKRHELLLESVNGPECGERRIPNPVISVTNGYGTLWQWTPGYSVTNYSTTNQIIIN
jgi:hypothetical protein